MQNISFEASRDNNIINKKQKQIQSKANPTTSCNFILHFSAIWNMIRQGLNFVEVGACAHDIVVINDVRKAMMIT